MLLYRSSNPKRRASLTFLSSPDEQSALLRKLEVKTWIEEIFMRQLPIPPEFQIRFGPPGFTKNPFYASEKRDTTFFEFGYGLLKRPSLYNLAISAVCYEVTFQGTTKPVDAARASSAAKILDSKSYSEAHRWILKLSPIPESIRYPSVRDTNPGGINFAIFEPSAVASTKAEIEEVLMTPRSNGTVELESLSRGKLPTITPIR